MKCDKCGEEIEDGQLVIEINHRLKNQESELEEPHIQYTYHRSCGVKLLQDVAEKPTRGDAE